MCGPSENKRNYFDNSALEVLCQQEISPRGHPLPANLSSMSAKETRSGELLSNRPATPARRLGDFQTVLTKHRLAAGLAIWSDTHPFS